MRGMPVILKIEELLDSPKNKIKNYLKSFQVNNAATEQIKYTFLLKSQ